MNKVSMLGQICHIEVTEEDLCQGMEAPAIQLRDIFKKCQTIRTHLRELRKQGLHYLILTRSSSLYIRALWKLGALWNLITVLFIKVNGTRKLIEEKVRVLKSGGTVPNIVASGETTKRTEKVDSSTTTGMFTRETGSTTRHMVLGFMSI